MKESNELSDQEKIRLQNQLRILRFLYNKRECTKQEISGNLGLSIPTIANNVNELISQNIVAEIGPGESSGGRKPVMYKFNPLGILSLGIEVTPHGLRSVILNMDAEILERSTISPIPATQDSLFDIVLEHYESARLFATLQNTRIGGIGVSLPGIIEPETQVLISAPNLPIRKIQLSELKNRLDVPLFLENEANAAVISEKVFDETEDLEDIVYLSITEGVGAGIYLANQLYRGRRNRAGEIGHICLVPGGKPCNCGSSGCLEQYVSKTALLNDYNLHSENTIEGIEDFINRLSSGDETAESVWEHYVTYLSLGIQNLIHLFDPSMIIIGGDLAAMNQVLIPSIKKNIETTSGAGFGDDISIKYSSLGADAAIIGAGLQVFDHFHL